MVREAATERLLDVASIEEDEWPNDVARAKDWIIWRLVYAGNGAGASTGCAGGSLNALHPTAQSACLIMSANEAFQQPFVHSLRQE